jgi:hypothetical protein
MIWEVEYTNEFEAWWITLSTDEQDSIDVVVELLEIKGPNLPFPYSSGIQRSRHKHMRELRVQHRGEPLRILYAFDQRRVAILLLGGNKIGDNRWYEENIPKADTLYDEHLEELRREELL